MRGDGGDGLISMVMDGCHGLLTALKQNILAAQSQQAAAPAV
jgi:hypothetical protein